MNRISKSRTIITLLMALVIIAGMFGAAVQPAAAASGRTVTIPTVVSGKFITLEAKGFPFNTAVTVRMGPMGSKAANGTIVGTATTASNGSLKGTYQIPTDLKNLAKIAVRVEVTSKPSQFAYNWFTNATIVANPTNAAPGGALSAGNLKITDVNEDKDVSFSLTNAPAGAKLNAFIDWKTGSGAMQGKQAGTVNVNSSGAASGTIKLPTGARDRGSLRLRLQGQNFIAYTWFTNANDASSGGGAPSSSTGGLPYMIITNSVPGTKVTIKAFNLPKGEYVVKMDKMGSQAKNGVKVDTVSLSGDKPFVGTFEIPDSLAGEDQIAIRIQNVNDSAYYAYTFFDNVA